MGMTVSTWNYGRKSFSSFSSAGSLCRIESEFSHSEPKNTIPVRHCCFVFRMLPKTVQGMNQDLIDSTNRDVQQASSSQFHNNCYLLVGKPSLCLTRQQAESTWTRFPVFVKSQPVNQPLSQSHSTIQYLETKQPTHRQAKTVLENAQSNDPLRASGTAS